MQDKLENHWRFAVQESANKSAATAASPECVKFQAVIKLAASTASRKPKIQGSVRRLSSASQAVARALPWILGFLEAALAADLITA